MERTIEKSKGNKVWVSRKARSFNQDWSSETEVHDFLYGFVRALKPEKVLEIGTFEGDTALAIARALKENKLGHLTTTDIHNFGQEEFLMDNNVDKFVTCIKHEPNEYLRTIPSESFDMVFIDGSHEYKDVVGDMESANRLLKRFGYMLGHDAIMIPDVVNAYNNFVSRNSGKYQHMVLDTYDGVFLLKKMHG